jgi:hypothetical protein
MNNSVIINQSKKQNKTIDEVLPKQIKFNKNDNLKKFLNCQEEPNQKKINNDSKSIHKNLTAKSNIYQNKNKIINNIPGEELLNDLEEIFGRNLENFDENSKIIFLIKYYLIH